MSGGPLRILHCHYSADPGGGSDRSLFELVSHLPRERFAPAVLLATGDPMAEAYRDLGVRVFETVLVPPRKAFAPGKLLRFAANYAVAVRRIAGIIGAHDAQLVHVNTLTNVQSAAAAHASGRPLVWHVRELMPESRAYRALTRRAGLWADRAVAISGAVADELGCCGERLRIIPNSVDLERFASGDGAAARRTLGLPEAAPVVALIARIEPWKGQHVMAEAAPRVLAAHPDTHFVFVGDAAVNKPRYAAELKARCVALGLGGAVHFPGAWEDVPGLLAASAVLVAPSVTPEPFGRTLAEAMAAGRPVVASRAGGPLDIVEDGKTGLLVPPGDAGALAEAIIGLLDAPERAAAMGALGREVARKRYGLARLVDEMGTLFEGAARGDKD